LTGEAPGAATPEPADAGERPGRRDDEPITDYGAVTFLFVLFFLAIGLMYLIGPGHP
jgi:hypothetical protein